MRRWKSGSWTAPGAVGLSLSLALGTALTGIAVTGMASPANAAGIAATVAQSKVTKKVPGRVLSVKKTRRDGFISWAVTIQRRDGSIVVGYVDQSSGIVFDWTVQRGPGGPVVDIDGPDGTLAPAKPPVTSPVSGGGSANDGTAPKDPAETEPTSTEDPGSGGGGDAPGGSGAPSGGYSSGGYVDDYGSWDNAAFEASWQAFWNWVVSSWTPVEPPSDLPGGSSGGTWYMWTGGSFTWDGTSVTFGDSNSSDDSSGWTDDSGTGSSDTGGAGGTDSGSTEGGSSDSGTSESGGADSGGSDSSGAGSPAPADASGGSSSSAAGTSGASSGV